MNSILVAIAGETAAGKTTLRNDLVNNYRAFSVATRDPLVAYAREVGLPSDKAGLQEAFRRLAAIHGNGVIWDRLRDTLTSCEHSMIVVEGLRRLVDLERIEELARALNRQLLIIYLHAHPRTRFERHNERARRRGESTIDTRQFAELELHLCEAELVPVRVRVEGSPNGIVIDTSRLSPEQVYHAAKERISYQPVP